MLPKEDLKKKIDSSNNENKFLATFINNQIINNQSYVSISIIGVSVISLGVIGYFYLNSNFKGIEGMLYPLNQSNKDIISSLNQNNDKTIALLNQNNKSNETIIATLNQYNNKAIEELDQINNSRIISSLDQSNKSFKKKIKREPANKEKKCSDLTPVKLYIKK